MAFTLTSSAFQDGGTIPQQFTCDGNNLAPPLAWSDAPERTRSFALVMEEINLPASASVDHVRDAYRLAWTLGCKGITVYRQGTRTGQVLTPAHAHVSHCPECAVSIPPAASSHGEVKFRTTLRNLSHPRHRLRLPDCAMCRALPGIHLALPLVRTMCYRRGVDVP